MATATNYLIKQGCKEKKLEFSQHLQHVNKAISQIDLDIVNLENLVKVMKQTQKFYKLKGWNGKVPIDDLIGEDRIKTAEKKLYELANMRVQYYNVRSTIVGSYFHDFVWGEFEDA